MEPWTNARIFDGPPACRLSGSGRGHRRTRRREAGNLIDAGLTIKDTTPTEHAEGGLGVLGQDGWGVCRIGRWAAAPLGILFGSRRGSSTPAEAR